MPRGRHLLVPSFHDDCLKGIHGLAVYSRGSGTLGASLIVSLESLRSASLCASLWPIKAGELSLLSTMGLESASTADCSFGELGDSMYELTGLVVIEVRMFRTVRMSFERMVTSLARSVTLTLSLFTLSFVDSMS